MQNMQLKSFNIRCLSQQPTGYYNTNNKNNNINVEVRRNQPWQA